MEWCKKKDNKELGLKIAVNSLNKQIGFIEYIPAEKAWRPIIADNYFFIHCIAVFAKESRNQNVGSSLIKACEEKAKNQNKLGVCVMTSDGPWISNKKLFEKNGYSRIDKLGRYELMIKKFDPYSTAPKLINWKNNKKNTKVGI